MAMKVSGRNIGVNFIQQQAQIKVWAPNAKSVTIKTAKELSLDLVKENRGYWTLTTHELKPGDKYWFVLDGGAQFPDPASLAQPEGVHGPSMALDLRYEWKDEQWENIPLIDYIIYELHTGTFSAEGTFSGIAARLDHLIDLGITAIEIMPIGAFPGNRNWGYDGVFPFAVQHSYGGATALQDLVNICHLKGLAVILDVVYNHVGPEGNYLGQFGPYFTEKYKTPWGNAVNYDDAYCDGVRQYVVENTLMWFRDFHIDALRLDAVHAIKDFGACHILQEIREGVNELMAQTGKKHYLMAESDLNDPRYISPVAENGLGMDAQWVDEFHHALRVSAGEKKRGYYLDFNGVEHLAKSFRDAYVYTGQYSEERKKNFGRAAESHPGQQFIVFSQNHDQVGNRMLGERSSTLYSYEMQKLLAAAVLFAPYQPLLFMGEEYGETNPFLYFVSHSDQELIEMVRKGRKEEFSAMHAQGEAPDPQSEVTFNSSKLNWELLTSAKHQALLAYYKQLISLRKRNPVLRANDRSACKATCFAAQNCLLLERGITGENNLVLCLMNFSDQVQLLTIPKGVNHLIKIAASAAPEVSGPQIKLQPFSFTAYTANYV
jgi:maltooligosyltrehalose trehalohydrolase